MSGRSGRPLDGLPDVRDSDRSLVRGGFVGIGIVALVTAGLIAVAWVLTAVVLVVL